MVARNPLLQAPPYQVGQALKRLEENLRLARTRRNLTIKEATQKIGAGPCAVMDAEKGKPSTSTGVYAALLWAYDLLTPLVDMANPNTDEVGLTVSSNKERTRVRKSKGLGSDF